MPVCRSCGQENPEIARFCLACGAPLGDDAAPAREERKVVTVLFCDLVGSTARAEGADPEDVRALLSAYHERVRLELERFGGTVEKFIGDAVMALFGAPTAHEDDPERAVRAALAIREWAQEEGDLQVRIGITTGEALVALGASPQAGEGMASGDVVNTAARLQSAAPVDGILVNETTYRATRTTIDYAEAGPVQAKGKRDPIAVWGAREARARVGTEAVSTQAPLVGRSRELTLLRETLVRVREERSPQLVTLVGVPGIGKSRLVHELLQVVEESGVLTYWRRGRSLPYGEGVSFWALAEMVKAQAGIIETDSNDEVEGKLKSAVSDLVPSASEAAWVEAHLRPLVGLGAETEIGADRRSDAFAAWRRLFEAMAERRPLVLVFEDLHWADEGLLDFVDHLVEWASGVPILITCTARPDFLERRPGWGGGKLNATALSLSPLSDEDIARLLGALLDQPLLEADKQHTLLALAGGNPLYAEQYSRLVLERDDPADLPLPESVQGIIAARLDRLRLEEKTVLQDAAVLGKVFWLGGLVDSRARSEIEERLHALERKGFVQRARRSSLGEEAEYAFLHVLVRDIAYAQIPRAERAGKHRRAAEWIESLGRPEDHAEMLAHHYRSALELGRAAGEEQPDVAARARSALEDAGDRALALNAFGAAVRYYDEALALWPAEARSERAGMLYRRAVALHGAGDERSHEAIEQARLALVAEGDEERVGELHALLAEAYWYRDRRDLCRDHLRHAEEVFRDRPPTKAKVRVLAQVARYRMLADELEEAIRDGEEALVLAETLGLDELRASLLTTIGSARTFGGDEAGLIDFERSIAIAQEINSPEMLRAYNNLAAALGALRGDRARALELLLRGLHEAERLGNRINVRWFEGQLIFEEYWNGRFDETMRRANDFIDRCEAGESHYLERDARWLRGAVRLARDDEGGAASDAERAHELVGLAGSDPQQTYPPLAMCARIFLELGRTSEASELTEQILRAWAENLSATTSVLTLAPVVVELGREHELLEVASRSRAETPWVRAARAYAEHDFAAVAEICARIAKPDEAHARLRTARQLIDEGRRGEADEHLQKALAFYRSVGATRYIREGEKLLAKTA